MSASMRATLGVYANLREYEKQAPVMPRPTPMKVLCLGYSRTGTMSTVPSPFLAVYAYCSQAMYVAFKKLGYKPYHFLESTLQKQNDHQKLWLEALNAKFYGKGKPFEGEDFDQMLWNYDVSRPVSSLPL